MLKIQKPRCTGPEGTYESLQAGEWFHFDGSNDIRLKLRDGHVNITTLGQWPGDVKDSWRRIVRIHDDELEFIIE